MPTRLKVIGLTILAVFICYIDRVNISITIIPMAKELGWDYKPFQIPKNIQILQRLHQQLTVRVDTEEKLLIFSKSSKY